MKKNIEITAELLKSIEDAKKPSSEQASKDAVMAIEIVSKMMDSITAGKKIDVGYFNIVAENIKNKILPNHEHHSKFEANKKAIIEKLKNRRKKTI